MRLKYMFTDKDLMQFKNLGVTSAEVEQQITNFKVGFPFLLIEAPATPQKGISLLNQQQQAHYTQQYDRWHGKQIKFVPASGAATRMFKSLYEAMQKFDDKQLLNRDDKSMVDVSVFFKNISQFAFYEQLKLDVSKKGVDIDNIKDGEHSVVLHALLDSNGLNYGSLPKGLLSFHCYAENIRTAFEEHLMEAALYGKDAEKVAALHFTVSPEHRGGFEKLYNKVRPNYEQKYDVRYNTGFSEQKKSTDTIAVDLNNQAFRNTDGTILFRPAGHGALLENLNELDYDLIFIKNIDNVVPEQHILPTVHWKKVLAGVLIEKQQIVFNYLKQLEKEGLNESDLNKILQFLEDTFCIVPPKNISKTDLHKYLYKKLNRPVRVCGMVKNVGEPGGGPFIAYDTDGSLSLQIAEPQQIDINNAQQQELLKKSTHFNPVDLVCSPRNYKGEKFDLLQYRDNATGFISLKSKDGKDLKAQELPGLWNGAMSDWNTIFVEVPLITFNPVKTVNDLLRKEHQ